MPKVVACSRRRPGLTRADYFRYLQFVHGTISHKFAQPTMGYYTQNHVIDGAFGTTVEATHENWIADRDGVVELAFDNWRNLYATFGHPDVVQWIASDGKFFADERNTIIAICEEVDKHVPNPKDTFNPGYGLADGAGGVKVMQYLKRADGVFLEDYVQHWDEAHEYAMEHSPYCREQLRRYVQNHRLAQSENVKAHFGVEHVPNYDGIASYWFDTTEYLGAFRQYNDALREFPKQWVNWAQSFFLYVKEVTIHYRER